MTDGPIIEIEGLELRRPEGRGGFVLEVPRLLVEAGCSLALVGPSGCGKTTLLDVLGLLLAPSRVSLFRLRFPGTAPVEIGTDRQDAALDRHAALRRSQLGYVLQQGGLLPFLTVGGNTLLAPDRSSAERVERARRLADRLGIGHLWDRKPDSISAGERQRTAIARALLDSRALVLADEPTAALDPPTAAEVMTLLQELAAERGVALVLASHDLALMGRAGFTLLRPTIRGTPDGTHAVFSA